MNNLLHKFGHQVLVNDLFIFIIIFFFLHKDSSLDQTSHTAQKPADQIEDDRQEMKPSIPPTNTHFQKQSSPIVNPSEEPSKQNAE